MSPTPARDNGTYNVIRDDWSKGWSRKFSLIQSFALLPSSSCVPLASTSLHHRFTTSTTSSNHVQIAGFYVRSNPSTLAQPYLCADFLDANDGLLVHIEQPNFNYGLPGHGIQGLLRRGTDYDGIVRIWFKDKEDDEYKLTLELLGRLGGIDRDAFETQFVYPTSFGIA